MHRCMGRRDETAYNELLLESAQYIPILLAGMPSVTSSESRRNGLADE